MVQIIPAILATTEGEYRDKLSKIEKSEFFKNGWVQIDLMDSKFVQNKSIEPEIIAKYPTDLKQEAHLMVEYPENWIDELVKLKIERIVFPVEDKEGIRERINHIKNHGTQVGLSINPETETYEVERFLADLDVILLMSVHPGFGGQKFIPEVLKKIKDCSRLRANNKFLIGVDGGISSDNAKLVVEAGADYLVMGSQLLQGNIEANLEGIWEVIYE